MPRNITIRPIAWREIPTVTCLWAATHPSSQLSDDEFQSRLTAAKGSNFFINPLKQDFQFIKEFMPVFWDIYRDTALNAINAPTLSSDEAIKLISQLQKVMRKFPPEYQGEEKEEKQFLIYLVACLDSLERTQNVRLSNATVHMMLFIWAHSRIK